MGLFNRRKKKVTTNNDAFTPAVQDSSGSNNDGENGPDKKSLSELKIESSTDSHETSVDAMDSVMTLLPDLDNPNEASVQALRQLYVMSEDSKNNTVRINMATMNNGILIHKLLDYLEICEKGSNGRYLALLVLNHVSIPMETKRFIAIDCRAAKLLALLLCDDPSCHLIAIVLVNLTFADEQLRSDLVKPDIQLVEALSFCLRAATLTQQEYEYRQPLLENDPENPKSPAELLSNLLAEDGSLDNIHALPDPSTHLFPQTARWCLTALKNLTRPCDDYTTAQTLINVGIVPYILRFLVISEDDVHKDDDSILMKPLNIPKQNSNAGDTSHSSEGTPVPIDPEHGITGQYINLPKSWGPNSPEDAAMFILLNLSAISFTRDYLTHIGVEPILSAIIKYHGESLREEEQAFADFALLRARMNVAYLKGSEGHFGQPKSSRNVQTMLHVDESLSLISQTEALQLEEMLAIVLHGRSKEGSVSYSAATLSIKYVVMAIRCLLTKHENQVQFHEICGPRLNALLLKVVAHHVFNDDQVIDAETAGQACFSLYLLSNFGFKDCFLPYNFGGLDIFDSVTAKIITSYKNRKSTTAASRHAATQLLLRLRWLVFKGVVNKVLSLSGTTQKDLWYEKEILNKIEKVTADRICGAQPNPDIFDRPLLRCRAPRKGRAHVSPWDNHASIAFFPNALEAAQELSFGSIKVRHMHAIDDIQIANNIAHSAAGEKTESYNYLWSWEDIAGEIHRNLERKGSSESFLTFTPQNRTIAGIGFVLGGLCACDTTSDAVVE